MKLYFRKRIGQSSTELSLSIVYSFFLHVLVALATVFLYIKATPRVHVPLFYQVTLVGMPPDLTETPPPEEASPATPKKEPVPKLAKVTPKAKKVMPKKGNLPEFFREIPKPATVEATPPATSAEQPQVAVAGPVAVTAPEQDFKFSWYLTLVRDKIGRNWRPPPDANDAKAKILFTVNRSGWVDNVNLDTDHSSGTFGFQQAAVRAIRLSNPFPPLPEEFSKLSVEFSVDLMAGQ